MIFPTGSPVAVSSKRMRKSVLPTANLEPSGQNLSDAAYPGRGPSLVAAPVNGFQNLTDLFIQSAVTTERPSGLEQTSAACSRPPTGKWLSPKIALCHSLAVNSSHVVLI